MLKIYKRKIFHVKSEKDNISKYSIFKHYNGLYNDSVGDPLLGG